MIVNPNTAAVRGVRTDLGDDHGQKGKARDLQ